MRLENLLMDIAGQHSPNQLRPSMNLRKIELHGHSWPVLRSEAGSPDQMLPTINLRQIELHGHSWLTGSGAEKDPETKAAVFLQKISRNLVFLQRISINQLCFSRRYRESNSEENLLTGFNREGTPNWRGYRSREDACGELVPRCFR